MTVSPQEADAAFGDIQMARSSVRRSVCMIDIIQATADYYGVTVSDLRGHCRKRKYAWARQVAWVAIKDCTSTSASEVGRFFGGRNHATILYGIKAVPYRKQPHEAQALAAIKDAALFKMVPSHHAVRFMPIGFHKFAMRTAQ